MLMKAHKVINLLIISHDANRVGGPILLLNLAEALTASGKYSVSFLIKQAPLVILDRFKKYPCYIATNQLNLFTKIVNKFSRRFSFFKSNQFNHNNIVASLKGIDIVLSNTITNGDILPIIANNFKGVICSYIHELEMSARLFTTPNQIQQVIKHSNLFMVPSDAVKRYLEHHLHIEVNKIHVLPYYIPPPSYENIIKQRSQKFIVGGVGTAEWRKGTDLFIQTAVLFFARSPEAQIEFHWKGASENIDLERHQYEIDKANLTGKIIFKLNSADINDFFASIDLFILPSREDPYPLVVLEAANYELPCICFTNAGGSPEFIKEYSSGICVNYLNTEQIANAVLYYYTNKNILKEQGKNAKTGVIKKHQNATAIAEIFSNIINEYQ